MSELLDGALSLFTVEESWKMDEAQRVLALVREVGVWRLNNCDGCMCGGFEVRNVKVDIACGKSASPRGVWVSSRSADYADEDERLRPIADEVARQVQKSDKRGPMEIYLRPWNRKLDICKRA